MIASTGIVFRRKFARNMIRLTIYSSPRRLFHFWMLLSLKVYFIRCCRLTYESASLSTSSSFQPPARGPAWWNVYRRSFHPCSGSSVSISKTNCIRQLSAHQFGQFITTLDISLIQIYSYLNVGCQMIPKTLPFSAIKQRGSPSQQVQEAVLVKRMFPFSILKLKMIKGSH